MADHLALIDQDRLRSHRGVVGRIGAVRERRIRRGYAGKRRYGDTFAKRCNIRVKRPQTFEGTLFVPEGLEVIYGERLCGVTVTGVICSPGDMEKLLGRII